MKIKNENFINYSIISFGLYPIMPNSLKGVFMIFLFLSSSFYFLMSQNRKLNFKPFLINSALFFLYLLSLLYTKNLYYGFKNLGPGISILLFSLVFNIFLGNYKIKRNIINHTLNLFTFSTFLFLFIYFIHILFVDRPDNPYFDYPTSIFFRNTIMDMAFLGHHPIYVSIFIGISIINLIRVSALYYSNNIKIYFFLLIIPFVILITTLFLLSSKTAIISLIIIAIIIYFLNAQNKIQSFFIGFITLSIFICFILFTPHINNRFKELIKSETYSIQKIDIHNSSQIRIAIWKTSIDNIKKAPLLGYGIGDVQSELNKNYKDKYPILLKEIYNSHNQYFGIWLSTGIIGLLFFFYFLYYNFKIGFNNKDYIFLAIIFFFSINFLTENVIERQAGATLFFFFINLFGFYNYSNPKNIATKKGMLKF